MPCPHSKVQGSTRVVGEEIKAQFSQPGKAESRTMAIRADGEIVKFEQ